MVVISWQMRWVCEIIKLDPTVVIKRTRSYLRERKYLPSFCVQKDKLT